MTFANSSKAIPEKVGDLMTRLYGSSELFPDDLDDAYHPAQSINYVTSHDCLRLLMIRRPHRPDTIWLMARTILMGPTTI